MTNIQGIRSDSQNAQKTMAGGSWHCTGGSDQNYTQEKEMKKSKMVVWGGLKIAEKRREAKVKEKRKDRPIKCRVPKNTKERQESRPQWSLQINRGK